MENNGFTSNSYPLREPRDKIEEWKAHAREKYDMPLASMIRWFINLDMKGQLDRNQNRMASQIEGQEMILLKERIRELEREMEEKESQLVSKSMSSNVRAIISLALNMEKEVRRLFSDQPGLAAKTDVIAGSLGIQQPTEAERRALEFVLDHLFATGFLKWKRERYVACG